MDKMQRHYSSFCFRSAPSCARLAWWASLRGQASWKDKKIQTPASSRYDNCAFHPSASCEVLFPSSASNPPTYTTCNHFIGWKEPGRVGILKNIHLPHHCVNKKKGGSRILSDFKVPLPFGGRSGTKHRSPEVLRRAICSPLSFEDIALGFGSDFAIDFLRSWGSPCFTSFVWKIRIKMSIPHNSQRRQENQMTPWNWKCSRKWKALFSNFYDTFPISDISSNNLPKRVIIFLMRLKNNLSERNWGRKTHAKPISQIGCLLSDGNAQVMTIFDKLAHKTEDTAGERREELSHMGR